MDEAAPVDRAVPVSVPDGVVAAAAGSSGDVDQLAEPRGEPQSISPDHLHVGSTQPVPVKACDGQATSVADVSVHIDVESKTAAASGPESKQPAHIPKPPPSSNMRPDYHAHAGANDLSKSQIAKAVVDTLVLAWCFLLPIIAAYLREKDPVSGTTSCIFTTPATNASATITLSIDQATTTCTGGTCSVQCSSYDPEVFKPLPRGWRVLIGLIPIVVVFEGILSFKLSSRYVAPFSMVYTIVLGCMFFRDATFFRDNNTIPGVLGAATLVVVDRFFWAVVEYVFNVFAAFFFMRVLELWGLVESMRQEFSSMAKTPTRKVLVVGFCFAILLAVVAPGGSNYIVAGAILIEMNPSNLKGQARLDKNVRIGTICLFGNALISAFNLLGICVTTIAEDIKELAFDHPNDIEYAGIHIGRLFSIQFFVFSWLSPLIMACLYSDQPTIQAKLKELKPELPILLSTGFVYSLVQLLTAWFIGPELPCLTAGGLALAWYMLLEYWGHLSVPSLRNRGYLLPFAILIAVLLLMRLVPYVEEGLIGDWGDGGTASSILDPWVWNVQSGGFVFKRTLPWLWHSGVIVTVIALLTPFITTYVPPPDTSKDESEADTSDGTGDDNASGCDLDADSSNDDHIGSVGISTPAGHKRVRLPAASSLPLNDGTLTCWVPASADQTAVQAVQAERARRRLRLAQFVVLALSRDRKQDANTNKNRRAVLATAFREAVADVLPVIASITAFAAIASLMDRFSMIQVVADFLVDGLSSAPALYALLMPFIGTLGSGLTGSTTTSNFLFGRLQATTAKQLELVQLSVNSVYEVAATNILGASAGEIVAPMNAVVITLMKGIGGTEARLIKAVMPLACAWLVATMVVSLLFLVPPGGFID